MNSNCHSGNRNRKNRFIKQALNQRANSLIKVFHLKLGDMSGLVFGEMPTAVSANDNDKILRPDIPASL